MLNDVQDALRDILVSAIESASKGADSATEVVSGKSNSGRKTVAATVGAAAIAPLALKGVGKLAQELGIDPLDVIKSPEKALASLTADVGGRVGAGIGDKVSQKVDEFGGPSTILKESVMGALPFGGGGGGTKGGALGVGKGRRMPVQQSIDIGVPLETVYNQWTQYELWPSFMHRVTDVTQKDQCAVNFNTKIWGKKKEFSARIETQRPDERVKWKVEEGISHTGVVTFHEIGPRLTRVLVNLDIEPGGMLEKAARGLRHVKRAVRADLHRFKAFIEIQEVETGAWRGVIENGKVVQEHDKSYDKDREYSKFEDVFKEPRSKKPTPEKEESGSSSSSRSRSSSGSGSRMRPRRSARSPRAFSRTRRTGSSRI